MPMAPADLPTTSSAKAFDIAYSYQKRSGAPFPHAILNTQLFLDYPNAGSRFEYRIIPITVNCYGQHAIARRGGLARFAAIADERLDPSDPRPLAASRWAARWPRRSTTPTCAWRWSPSSSWSHAFLTDKTLAHHPDTSADRRLYQLFVDRDYATWQATPSRRHRRLRSARNAQLVLSDGRDGRTRPGPRLVRARHHRCL